MRNKEVQFLHGGDCGGYSVWRRGEKLREQGEDVHSVETNIRNLLEEEGRRNQRWYWDLGESQDPACQKYTKCHATFHLRQTYDLRRERSIVTGATETR